MMFDHDKVSVDDTGTHKRGSLCVALVGEMTCGIKWAVNAMSIHIPTNMYRTLIIQPHANLDVARNLAIESFVKEKRLKADYLLLWANGQVLHWDVTRLAIERLDSNGIVQIGDAHFIARDRLKDLEPPWFVDGKWRYGDVVDGSDNLVVDIREFAADEPANNNPDATGDQVIVTCIPSLGTTSLVWVGHAMQLAGPVAAIRYLAVMVNREVADARQRLVEAVLKMTPVPKWVFFYGDDMIPEPTSLQMIFETAQKFNYPAAAGLYHMKVFPPALPLLWTNQKPGLLVAGRDFRVGDPVFCDGTGLDFCVLRTDALLKMRAKYPLMFKTGLEWVEGHGPMIHTEDAFFWSRFADANEVKTLVDTRARIGHYSVWDGGIY